MFGISLPEIILILIIVIIFVRPEDLPKFLRSAGRLYGKARRMYKEIIGITNQVVNEMDSIASLDVFSESGTPKKNTPPLASAPVDLVATELESLPEPEIDKEPDKN